MERHGVSAMSILRLETRTGPREPRPKAAPEEEPSTAGASNPKAAAGGGSRQSSPRVYEYVHITTLYDTLRAVLIPQCIQPSSSRSIVGSMTNGHEMTLLAALIGLTGTDFTRGLPLTSGKAVYDALPTLWTMLAGAYNPATRSLDPDRALIVVARIYQVNKSLLNFTQTKTLLTQQTNPIHRTSSTSTQTLATSSPPRWRRSRPRHFRSAPRPWSRTPTRSAARSRTSTGCSAIGQRATFRTPSSQSLATPGPAQGAPWPMKRELKSKKRLCSNRNLKA